MTEVLLAEGQLNWNRYERVGDRYGTVNIWNGEDWPEPAELFASAPVGTVGTLSAVVTESRESAHIGDLAHGIGAGDRAAVGERVELGHGELFIEHDRGIGVKPDRPLAIKGLKWQGDWPECEDCGATGYGPEAREIADSFYALSAPASDRARLRWDDKLSQAEVDHLWEQGRLHQFRKRVTDDHDKFVRWEGECPTATEVNRHQRDGQFIHDGINRFLLVDFRCQQRGITVACPRCDGKGILAPEGIDPEADRPMPADRETWWLHVPNLYRLHEQTVRLLFEGDDG